MQNLSSGFVECAVVITLHHSAKSKYQFGPFGKRDSFLVSIVSISDKYSNIPSNIVYSPVAAQSLRTAKTSSNPVLLSAAVEPLVICMSRHGISI